MYTGLGAVFKDAEKEALQEHGARYAFTEAMGLQLAANKQPVVFSELGHMRRYDFSFPL